ncbi:hypothetical protein SMD44_07876 [Streptomyces alboflavus]|uniref:Orc1-like AAA ATPase domain-containing protein n=1 Tax=Streptomyces alboflavus TaxID=67267 RepID=A0A1Z1WPR1_9ACTN|nr:hypothetical protein SMD44_07876 [Streptomyces alboflavus]
MGEHTGGLGADTGRAPDPDPGEPFLGRDAELARLFRAVDPASADPVLMLVGDAGTGKSALLDRAVRKAEAGGARVLRAGGSEAESSLAYAALHQLLRPVAAEVDALPERQRAALHTAFGTGPEAYDRFRADQDAGRAPAAPDLMLIGVAVLSLLSALGDHHPVLVVLDDAQWCDRASLDALSFAARRLEGEPVTMLIGARADDQLPGFDRRLPTLALGPLDPTAAARLLDLQPQRPTGRTRQRILDQAGGNPLALVELTRAATAPSATAPDAAGPPPAGPLPLTAHLEGIFAARLTGLPATTTRALLLLAAMDSADSAPAVLAGLPRADDEAWPPPSRPGSSGGRAGTSGSGTRWSGPPSITPRPRTPGVRLTSGSRGCCATSRTGVPGIGPPPARARTRPCRRTWSGPPHGPSDAAGTRRRPKPSSARRSSRRAARTAPGCSSKRRRRPCSPETSPGSSN